MRYLFLRILLLIPVTISRIMAHPLFLALSVCIGASFAEMIYDVGGKAACWSMPTMMLAVIDAKTGIKAARYRGERITFSHLLRGTGNKVLSYICWIFTVFCVGFLTGYDEIGIYGMLLSLVIECSSIVENHLEVKGLGISWKGVWETIKSVVSSKTGVDLGSGDIITHKGGRGCGEVPSESNEQTTIKNKEE